MFDESVSCLSLRFNIVKISWKENIKEKIGSNFSKGRWSVPK